VKRNYHTLDNQGKVNERQLAEFLTKNGQQILPMVELITQSRMAIDDLVDVVGRATIETVTEIGFLQIQGRVVRKLLELAATHGQQREDGSVEIAVSVSQSTMAGLIGASRENVNRALGTLTAGGNVQVFDGHFVIADPVGLRTKADRGWIPLHRRNRLAEELRGSRPGPE